MSPRYVPTLQPMLPFEEFESDLAVSPADDLKVDDPLYFMSFGSGSSGNSCYIGTDRGGIIVDAGVKTDHIEMSLRKHGIKMQDVKALLLTHDHSDHVRYAYSLLRTNRHMSLYCTPRVLNGILRRHNISKRIKDYHSPIFKEIPFKVGRMEITAFDVPHDGSDNMGFSLQFGRHRFVLATDLGEVTERADFYMRQANYLVIEANYDADMLRTGRYPEYLKARIATSNGHLDNMQTARFLESAVNPELKYVFLCHLSLDNNTPAKALKSVRDVLETGGRRVGNAMTAVSDHTADIQLSALPRFESSPLYIFR